MILYLSSDDKTLLKIFICGPVIFYTNIQKSFSLITITWNPPRCSSVDGWLTTNGTCVPGSTSQTIDLHSNSGAFPENVLSGINQSQRLNTVFHLLLQHLKKLLGVRNGSSMGGGVSVIKGQYQ